MREGEDVRKASIEERRPVEALGGRDPTESAAEAMVVVVGHEAHEGRFRLAHAAEALSIEHLGLEDQPKGPDLAVRPRRVDLGSEVIDVQVLQTLANRVSTNGIQVTKGWPLSLINSSGCPQSSKQSSSQVRMGAA